MYDHINERIKQDKQIRINRRREVRRQKIVLVSVLITLTAILSVTIGTKNIFAKAGGNNIRHVKQYKSVMIKCGDSIRDLASGSCSDEWEDESAFIHEVSMINHLDEDEELIAGNYLTVPYYVDVVVK